MRANVAPLFFNNDALARKIRPAGHPAQAGHDAIAASQVAFVPRAGQSANRKEPLSAKRDGLRLNAGNSENGGAGYLNDNDRSNRNDNLGARLAVVFSS